ncbi:hypothetical protein COU05_01625 [bacterium (Candidatus Gribaldobacteria) CG10_big_fil_rev_8_21_14_0_10_37_21]|uniref:Uncharacterized protein n=1 Tax=bacterium (Candidatus Gribaldobacteria) CG10_big_fil_rev_8_21_14_0_10_37_21 TaxID=2014275 RepID=A0A2H0UWR5_9BACT|nr:MAG: hypothetical protein COU05_01625 [bacterium (Candidatus Gribaldobacteria) CG10_big_fil_rev_8_21_14_0_10_37_21]
MNLDYQQLIKKYPWVVQENQNCIVSPDSDGLLCGLFMSNYLGWKIVGFYDGKVLVVKNDIEPKSCVYLDMEIFRKEVKSVGHHMVLYNKKHLPKNWVELKNCISANNLRDFDMKNNFPVKYPLGTIHLLLGIVGQMQKVNLPIDSLCPLLYTDGTFKNLFNYPDNCLDWFDFLGAKITKTSLNDLFYNEHYTIYRLMIALNSLFFELKKINDGKKGGDKIKISDKNGELINFNNKCLSQNTQDKAKSFLALLEQKTGWKYFDASWHWGQFDIFRFQKGIIKPSQGRYNDLMSKNPLSLAITSRNTLEYTLDKENIFLK